MNECGGHVCPSIPAASNSNNLCIYRSKNVQSHTLKVNFEWETGADTFNLLLFAPLQFDANSDIHTTYNKNLQCFNILIYNTLTLILII
jgi:hypothetical protein